MKLSTCATPAPFSAATGAGLLNIADPVPLTVGEMARTLRAAFLPLAEGDKLEPFRDSLRAAFREAGVSTLEFTEALAGSSRVPGGTTLISFGADRVPGDLAIDYISTLYNNPVVGVFFKPPPVSSEMLPQEILDVLSADFVWHMVHMAVYVTESTWTCCTMNGSIVGGAYGEGAVNDIANVLIPKLAAPIKPLRKKDFTNFKTEETSLGTEKYEQQIEDMVQAANLFRQNGMLPSQTKAATLSYQSRRYRRIGSDFLDNRTGMSYGFIARQLPSLVRPAMPLGEAYDDALAVFEETIDDNGRHSVIVTLDKTLYAVDIPDVAVLCTRSGCNKGNIDATRDIVKLVLQRCGSKSFFATRDVSDCEAKPSYDTMVIFAHAVGNAIIASLLAHLSPGAEFLRLFSTKGLAIAHWHSHLTREEIPQGHTFHGDTNPAVSCASPQSAIFALRGKLQAFAEITPAARYRYRGDVHVEPHHGTNVVDSSLLRIGHWSAKNISQAAAAGE